MSFESFSAEMRPPLPPLLVIGPVGVPPAVAEASFPEPSSFQSYDPADFQAFFSPLRDARLTKVDIRGRKFVANLGDAKMLAGAAAFPLVLPFAPSGCGNDSITQPDPSPDCLLDCGPNAHCAFDGDAQPICACDDGMISDANPIRPERGCRERITGNEGEFREGPPLPPGHERGWTCAVYAPQEAKVCVFGGTRLETPLASAWCLGLQALRWERIQDLPVPLDAMGCAIFNGEAYLIGGSSYSATAGERRPTRQVIIYNFDRNEWRDGPYLPYSRSFGRAAASEGGIVVVGGRNDYDGPDRAITYTRNASHLGGDGMWRPAGELENPLYGSAVLYLGGKLFSIGGGRLDWTGPSIAYDSIELYVPPDRWSVVGRLRQPLTGIVGTAGPDGLGYVIAEGAMWAFVPDADVPSLIELDTIPVPDGAGRNSFLKFADPGFVALPDGAIMIIGGGGYKDLIRNVRFYFPPRARM